MLSVTDVNTSGSLGLFDLPAASRAGVVLVVEIFLDCYYFLRLV